MGFPRGSVGKNSACNVGDLSLIHGLERSPEGDSYALQYSGLENSMDCIVHGVAKSRTQLRVSIGSLGYLDQDCRSGVPSKHTEAHIQHTYT